MFVSVCTQDKSTVDTLGAPGAFLRSRNRLPLSVPRFLTNAWREHDVKIG